MARFSAFWAKATKPENPVPERDSSTNECALEDDDCAIDDSDDLDTAQPPAPKFQKMDNVWTNPQNAKMHATQKATPINIDFDRQTIDVAARKQAAKNEPDYHRVATIAAVQQHIDVFGHNEHTQRLYGDLAEISNYKPRYDGDDEDRPMGRVEENWDEPADYIMISEKKRAIRQVVGLIPEGSQQLFDTYPPANYLGPKPRASILDMMVDGTYKPCQIQVVAYRMLGLEGLDNVARRHITHRTHQEMMAKNPPQDRNSPPAPIVNATTVPIGHTELQSDDDDENYVTEPSTPSTIIRTNTNSPTNNASGAIDAQQTENANTTATWSARHHPLSLPQQPRNSLLSQQLARLQNKGCTSLPATAAITETLEHNDTSQQPVTILQGLPSPTPNSQPSMSSYQEDMESACKPVTILQGLPSPSPRSSVSSSTHSNENNVGQPVTMLQSLPSPSPCRSPPWSLYAEPSPVQEWLSLAELCWISPPRQESPTHSSQTASPQHDDHSSVDEHQDHRYNVSEGTPISSPIQASPQTERASQQEQKREQQQQQRGSDMPMQRRPGFQREQSYLVRDTTAAFMDAATQVVDWANNHQNSEDQKTESTPQTTKRHVCFAPLPRREDYSNDGDNDSASTSEKDNYPLSQSPRVW